jgi:hypothetical protein
MEIQLCRPERFNSNNHEENRPFQIIDNVLIIDINSKWLFTILSAYYIDYEIIFDKIVNPLPPMTNDEIDFYLLIMNAYALNPLTTSWAQYHWAYQHDLLQMIPIANVEELIDLIMIRNVTGRDLCDKDFEPWYCNGFADMVNTALEKYLLPIQSPIGAFVKLSQKSPKKGFVKIRPCFTFRDVMDLITSSKELIKYLNIGTESNYLILCPYIKLDRKDEYRVFVINNKIKAISQQQCYTRYGYRDIIDQMKTIIKWFNNINFKYEYATLDVLVVKDECLLLEINPPGDWGSSGSSLFHWIDDSNIFYNDNDQIVVRIY